MKTTKHLPGKIVLLLALQIIVVVSLFAQDKAKSTKHTFVPLPELLLNSEGARIESSRQWEEIRRSEILELFREHVYGRVPEAELSVDFEVKYVDLNALGGSAVQKEVEVQVSNGSDNHTFSILIYLPKDSQGPVPLFLGLNFYGNHTIHTDKQISITDRWVRNNSDFGITENKATSESRGVRAHRWPVEQILSRGYGLATIYYGDIDPDFDDGFKNGIHRLTEERGDDRDPDSWGSIATWAWGLSRAMDYFETDADVDQKRVAVIGHSRLGKTSLWAGAQDERFAMVVSNNSGCGGAALSRRAFGERVSNINTSFPHWFASRFHDYNDNEAALPVDQHMLMALMAPRALYVASAREDKWADPFGEYLSLFYGSKVWGLYGNDVLTSDQLPEVDQPRLTGNLGYHIRTGKHDITLYDWEQYMDFADHHMPAAASSDHLIPVSL
ncbi:MAG: acetylxylan esterase [Bacteroidota bacterium]